MLHMNLWPYPAPLNMANTTPVARTHCGPGVPRSCRLARRAVRAQQVGFGGERFLSHLSQRPVLLACSPHIHHGMRSIARRNALYSATVAPPADTTATTRAATRADHNHPQPCERAAKTAAREGDSRDSRNEGQHSRNIGRDGRARRNSSSSTGAADLQSSRRDRHRIVANCCEEPSALLR